MTADEYRRFDSPRTAGHLTYLPPSYGPEGRFVVRSELASAGQGYVLRVEDTWSGGPAVLKGMWWLPAELADRQRAGSAVSLRNHSLLEGQAVVTRATQVTQQAPVVAATVWEPSPAMAGAGSPGEPFDEVFVVQRFVGEFDGTAWQAAPTLRDLLEMGTRLNPAELIDLADQLCGALAALHPPRNRRGVRHWVHCDVKPENILVLRGPPARYVLIDYDGAVQSGSPLRVTTDSYAPPDGEERDPVDQRFDIYMLGATLAQVAGFEREQREKLYRDTTAEAAKKALYQLGYGPILTGVIATCLARTRFAHVSLIQTELARARQTAALRAALDET